MESMGAARPMSSTSSSFLLCSMLYVCVFLMWFCLCGFAPNVLSVWFCLSYVLFVWLSSTISSWHVCYFLSTRGLFTITCKINSLCGMTKSPHLLDVIGNRCEGPLVFDAICVISFVENDNGENICTRQRGGARRGLKLVCSAGYSLQGGAVGGGCNGLG